MIRIDPDRLLADLDSLRAIGGIGSGVVRLAYSAADIEARRWLARRIVDASLTPIWDHVGNLFAMPHGERPILVGSHADTQPEGGWLDGAYGVICGLELARAAREAGRDDVAAVAFADEESTFVSLLGSRVWTGALALKDVLGVRNRDGLSLSDALAGVPEIVGGSTLPVAQFRCFIEPHIEQGPILDHADERAGVVTAIVGLRHVELVFAGDQNHAGTTPMAGRRDAVQDFIRFAGRLNALFASLAVEATVWTIGKLEVSPNSVSIIPSRVSATLQIRDADDDRLDTLAERALELTREMVRDGSADVRGTITERLSPIGLDRHLVQLLSDAAAARVGSGNWRRMVSGALHDAAPVSRMLPAAMIFAPSLGGKSHCFDEDTRRDDLVECCMIVADAISRLQESAR